MAVTLLQWSFLFMTVTMMVHTFIVFQGTIWLERNDPTDVYSQLRCAKLREKFSSLTAKRINPKSLAGNIKELMNCPQSVNITQRERYRVELQACCNATGQLILTKENTPLGNKIKYETNQNANVPVDKSFFGKLPTTTPWRKNRQIRRCAVVGNGGILQNSSCGADIDSADFVFRLNLAPIINHTEDVGRKTNLITINPSQIRVGYPKLLKSPRPLAERVSAYGNAPLVLSAFTYPYCMGISLNVYRALHPLRPEQKVVFFNPDYLLNLHRYWKRKGLKELRLTSGLMLASVATEMCEETHLYGFWPFDVNLSQQPISHHYYDNKGPSRRMHAMPLEFMQLLNMHNQGAIRLHLGAC